VRSPRARTCEANVSDPFRHGAGYPVVRQVLARGLRTPLHAVTIATLEEYRNRRLVACQPNTAIREMRELRAMLKASPRRLRGPSRIFPPENLTRCPACSRPTNTPAWFPHLREHYGAVFADLAELALLGVMRLADVRTLRRQYVRLHERLLLLPRTKGGPRAVRLK